MITFGELEIEGFCSIHKITINLDHQGINILKAINGSGKTTIFSAFSWVGYGQTLKKKNKVNTWEKYQPPKYKGTKVSLSFEKEGIKYQIIRCDSYKGKVLGIKGRDRLFLIQDGEERKDLRTKPETQKEITSILGYSHELFINSVVFGQKLKRIIEESGPNKKRVFEEAFEVSYINEAKKRVAEQREGIHKEESELSALLNSKLQSRSELEERLQESVKAKNKFKSQQEAEISVIESKLRVQEKRFKDPESIRKEIARLKAAFSILDNQADEVKELERTRFKQDMKLESQQGKAADTQKLIQKLKAKFPLPTKCSTCGALLSHGGYKEQTDLIKSDIAKLKKEYFSTLDEITVSKKGLKDLDAELASLQSVKDDIDRNKQNLSRLEATLREQESIAKDIKQYKQQIKAIKARKFTIKLKPIKKRIQILSQDIQPLALSVKKLTKKLETLNWLIKVPLSNSGIKAFIFDYMLGLVNEQLENYEKIIPFRINFSIDMDSPKRDFITTITRDGFEQTYDDLSGGEQQLANVALAFAIHDVMSLEKATNLLLMDEVFESLDESNIEVVSELIQQKAENKSVWIITHLASFNPSGSSLYLPLKSKGRTRLA